MNYNSQIYHAQESNFLWRVYAWMFFALGLSAIPAYLIGNSATAIGLIFSKPFILPALMILQLGLVVVLSFALNKISFTVAALLFTLYSLTMGVTLSTIFIRFAYASILTTFLVAAAMFAAMALYGYFTKSDLSSLGNFLFMMLIGLIIAMVINLFFKSAGFDYFLSAAGVFVFTLLTAYDVQKIKNIFAQMRADRETMNKIALVGALTLYLDFVNLFLFLLRFLGRGRD